MQLNDPTLFRQQALIDGNWRDANNGETIAVTNPANGQKLGSVPKMGQMKPAKRLTPQTALCRPGVR